MFFEYPKLLWLLVVPALLVLRYLYVELKDRRPHLRVSSVTPWKKGGKTVLGVIRHIPFILRIAALSLIVVAIARPRSSTKVEKVDTEGIDIQRFHSGPNQRRQGHRHRVHRAETVRQDGNRGFRR